MVLVKSEWEKREASNTEKLESGTKSKQNALNISKAVLGSLVGNEASVKAVFSGSNQQLADAGSQMSNAEFGLAVGMLAAMSVAGGVGSNLGFRSAAGLEGTKIPWWRSLPSGQNTQNRIGRYTKKTDVQTGKDVLNTLNEVLRQNGNKQIRGKDAQDFLDNPSLSRELAKVNANPVAYSARVTSIRLGKAAQSYKAEITKVKEQLAAVNKRRADGEAVTGDEVQSSRLPIDLAELEGLLKDSTKLETTYRRDAFAEESPEAYRQFQQIEARAKETNLKRDLDIASLKRQRSGLVREIDEAASELNSDDSLYRQFDAANLTRLMDLKAELAENDREGLILDNNYTKLTANRDSVLASATEARRNAAVDSLRNEQKELDLLSDPAVDKRVALDKANEMERVAEQAVKDEQLLRENVKDADERIRQLEDDLSYKQMLIRRGDGNEELLKSERRQSAELSRLTEERANLEGGETDRLLADEALDVEPSGRVTFAEGDASESNLGSSKTSRTPAGIAAATALAAASLIPGASSQTTSTSTSASYETSIPEPSASTASTATGTVEGEDSSEAGFSIKTTLDRANIDELLTITLKVAADAYDPNIAREPLYTYFGQFDVPVVFYLRNRTLYIGFRGTDSVSNFLTDIHSSDAGASNLLSDYGLFYDRLGPKRSNIKFHAGFIKECLQSYEFLEQKLKSVDNIYDRIVLGSHSLGGAVSQIFAYVYNNSVNYAGKKPISYVVTYGQPRALFDNVDYIKMYNDSVSNYIRCWNTGDPIAYFPFRKKVSIDFAFNTNMLSGYTHVGTSFNLRENLSNSNVNIQAYELIQGSADQLVALLRSYDADQTKRALATLTNKKYLSLLIYCYYQNLRVNDIKPDITAQNIEGVNIGVQQTMETKATTIEKCNIVKPFGLAELLAGNPIVDSQDEIESFVLSSLSAITVSGHKLFAKAHSLTTYQGYVDRLLDQEIVKGQNLFDIIRDRPYLSQERVPLDIPKLPPVVGITKDFPVESYAQLISY